MPIYTRTGDAGDTALFGGKRVRKDDAQVDAYGSVDELNSWVGLISVMCQVSRARIPFSFHQIQSDLFTIGSVLAGWKGDLNPVLSRVDDMEQWIDQMEKELPPLTSFILPGGSVTGAHIHVARNIVRKVERGVVTLSRTQTVDPIIMKYLNRLSDLFFMLARFINKHDGAREVAWIGIPRPKKPR